MDRVDARSARPGRLVGRGFRSRKDIFRAGVLARVPVAIEAPAHVEALRLGGEGHLATSPWQSCTHPWPRECCVEIHVIGRRVTRFQ